MNLSVYSNSNSNSSGSFEIICDKISEENLQKFIELYRLNCNIEFSAAHFSVIKFDKIKVEKTMDVFLPKNFLLKLDINTKKSSVPDDVIIEWYSKITKLYKELTPLKYFDGDYNGLIKKKITLYILKNIKNSHYIK